MNKILPLIIAFAFAPQLAKAEVLVGFGIRISPVCGNADALSDKQAESVISKNAEKFTHNTLSLFRKYQHQIIKLANTPSLRPLDEIEKPDTYNCKQYLDKNHQNIADALLENEKNKADTNYIPFDVIGYFIKTGKQLYPRFYGREPFTEQLEKYSESDPELYRILLERFRQN